MRSRVIRPIAWILCGLTCAAGLSILACSKPRQVNPDDAAQVRSIDTMVESLRKAYVNKDAAGFHSLLMPLESLRRLEMEAERDFAIYERINVDFGIDRVLIDGSDVAVDVHWQGQWQRKTDDQPVRERGHAILRLVGHQNLALSGVDGDIPFGMASRRLTGERSQER